MEHEEYERIHDCEERHFWYRGLHALAERQLRRFVPRGANRPRVLDAGCGTGGFASRIARDYDVTLLDFHPQALAFSRRRGFEPVRGSVSALPFANESFAAAVSFDVLYHAAVADDAVALRELARVVRRGGHVFLNLPAHERLASSHDKFIHGARRYSRRRVREIARGAGLEVVRLGWWNSTLFPLLAVLRYLRRNHAASSDVSVPAAPLNAALSFLLRAEGALFDRFPLPPGLSLFAVLRRP